MPYLIKRAEVLTVIQNALNREKENVRNGRIISCIISTPVVIVLVAIRNLIASLPYVCICSCGSVVLKDDKPRIINGTYHRKEECK